MYNIKCTCVQYTIKVILNNMNYIFSPHIDAVRGHALKENYKLMDRQIDRQTTIAFIDRLIKAQMTRWINRYIDRQIDKWIDIQLDVYVDRSIFK